MKPIGLARRGTGVWQQHCNGTDGYLWAKLIATQGRIGLSRLVVCGLGWVRREQQDENEEERTESRNEGSTTSAAA